MLKAVELLAARRRDDLRVVGYQCGSLPEYHVIFEAPAVETEVDPPQQNRRSIRPGVVSPRQIVEDGVFSLLHIQLRIQPSNRLRLKAKKPESTSGFRL